MDAIDYMPRLVRACLENDRRLVESVSLTVSRKLRRDRPDLASEIAGALAASGMRSEATRAAEINPLPTMAPTSSRSISPSKRTH